ncbi:MAG: hypothetical protein BRD30_03345, partial [Bacteroidetes bacterium QH_2_63_10]
MVILAASLPFLGEVVVLFALSALIAYLCTRIRLVPIAGFLLIGVAVGPYALGLVRDPEFVGTLAEIGVILLLFEVGIEFSLAKLARLKRAIGLGGGLQVGGTVVLVTGIGLWAGGDLGPSLYTGFLVALSPFSFFRTWPSWRWCCWYPCWPAPADRRGRCSGSSGRPSRSCRESGAGLGPRPARPRRGRGHSAAGALRAAGGGHCAGHRVASQSGGGEPGAGRVPRRARGQRERVQRADPERGAALPLPLQRRLLRLGGHAARSLVSLAGAAASPQGRRGRVAPEGRGGHGHRPGAGLSGADGYDGGTCPRPNRRVLVRPGAHGPRRGPLALRNGHGRGTSVHCDSRGADAGDA